SAMPLGRAINRGWPRSPGHFFHAPGMGVIPTGTAGPAGRSSRAETGGGTAPLFMSSGKIWYIKHHRVRSKRQVWKGISLTFLTIPIELVSLRKVDRQS